MRDEIAEIVWPDAGLAEGGLQRPSCKLRVGIAATCGFVSACKVSRDVARADTEPSRENRSLPPDVDLKT